jgi:hypothetical protein
VFQFPFFRGLPVYRSSNKPNQLSNMEVKMKIREMYKYLAIMGIILIFSASGAIAAEESPPETCECPGFNVGLVKEDGKFPVESDCDDPNSDDPADRVPCWKYEYTSSTTSLSAYGQTVPGLGPKPFIVYTAPGDSFSSISVSDPGDGTIINKACFGQNVYERRVINFTSAPSGNPTKFGYSANQSGVGWTSLYFKQGNDFCSCAIAGPDFAEQRYIKTAIKILFFGETRVRFEINFTDCTYRAFQEFPTDEDGNEIELTQHPESDITITVAATDDEDEETGQLYESESPGQCRELQAAFGTGTCSVYLLGGSYVRIPFGCDPTGGR